VAATFVLLLPFYKTAPQDHAYFHRDWSDAFPPLDGVGKLTGWFATVNTGFMFAYPEGGSHGLSALTFAGFVAGAVALLRRGRGTVAALLLAPFGLALVAAAMHRYPYGVSARTTQYAAPMICLLVGLGGAAALARLRSAEGRRRGLNALAVGLAVLGLWRLGYDLTHPYKNATY